MFASNSHLGEPAWGQEILEVFDSLFHSSRCGRGVGGFSVQVLIVVTRHEVA